MNITAIKNLIDNLNITFADMDAAQAVRAQDWAKGRCAAIAEFRDSPEYQTLRRDPWSLYPKLHAIAGGKGWYNLFSQGYYKTVIDFMTKNSEAIVTKRNALISKKLEAAGVTEVLETTYNRTGDGFNGVFVVNTDSGTKVVRIDTIYAGGYNIQCLHTRTLVKVR